MIVFFFLIVLKCSMRNVMFLALFCFSLCSADAESVAGERHAAEGSDEGAIFASQWFAPGGLCRQSYKLNPSQEDERNIQVDACASTGGVGFGNLVVVARDRCGVELCSLQISTRENSIASALTECVYTVGEEDTTAVITAFTPGRQGGRVTIELPHSDARQKIVVDGVAESGATRRVPRECRYIFEGCRQSIDWTWLAFRFPSAQEYFFMRFTLNCSDLSQINVSCGTAWCDADREQLTVITRRDQTVIEF